MINTTVFVEAWEPYLKDGFDILYVGMSSGISGSYSAACAAAFSSPRRAASRAQHRCNPAG